MFDRMLFVNLTSSYNVTVMIMMTMVMCVAVVSLVIIENPAFA